MPPNSSTAVAAIACADAGSETSVGTKCARPPADLIECATFSPASSWMSATTTAAPSAASPRAYASPIPVAAPVTTATLPSYLPLIFPPRSGDPNPPNTAMGKPDHGHTASARTFVSRYSSKPASPISRPIPDCLYPPNGTSPPYQTPPLTARVPVRIRAATPLARSADPLSTDPERPYDESLAMRTASSSPSCAMTTSTGPKISSRAARAVLSNPAITVGSTQNPASVSVDTRPPVANLPPSSVAMSRYALMRSRCAAEITGPQIVSGAAGSCAPNELIVDAAIDTASSYRFRGTNRRVVNAHPCPAWIPTLKAVAPTAACRSASSSTIAADLPPSSRDTFFTVSAASAMIFLPVAVDPVNETRSTRGSVVSLPATRSERGVTTLTTPGGISVRSRTNLPSSAASQGVSAAGLSTIVFPAARAGPSLARLIWFGKFQGV